MKRPATLALGSTRLCLLAALLLATVRCGSASPTQPSTGGTPTPFTTTAGAQILVDASKDGGVWWFPQGETFNNNADHQGKALADTMRSRGFIVDELPRAAALTGGMLSNYRLIIRVGNCFGYSSSEIAAYEQQLSREMTLVLLTDHMNGGCTVTDPLALRFGGIRWTGGETGTITNFTPHAITSGVSQLSYIAGATVASVNTPGSVDMLGFIGPKQQPVMGIIKGRTAKIFFLGDSNGIEHVPQPFVDNLLNWALK